MPSPFPVRAGTPARSKLALGIAKRDPFGLKKCSVVFERLRDAVGGRERFEELQESILEDICNQDNGRTRV